MIVRHVLAAALLGAGLLPAAAAQRAGEPEALIARFEAEDARCALPPSPMTAQACEDREENDEHRLARAGWCRAAGGWDRCRARCPRQGPPAHAGGTAASAPEAARGGWARARDARYRSRPRGTTMQDDTDAGRPPLDEDTIAFAGGLFQYARMGHAEELAELLAMACRRTCATTRATR